VSDLTKHYIQLVGIAKSWACKNIAGWDDQMHRDLLARHGAAERDGRTSASTLNAPQLDAVLSDYEARGWTRQRRQFAEHAVGASNGGQSTVRTVRAVPARIALIVKLWAGLAEAGKIEHGDRKALLAWVERQTGHTVPNLDALTVPECQKLIEALKGYMARK
jgi:hypothetical protein